jgi:ferric-dicitrate binding protein FerR (iron transport regulator)
MDCEQALPLLHAQLDREIDPEALAALEEHLRQCAACRLAFESYRALDGDLRRAFAERRRSAALLPQKVDGRIGETIRAPASRIRWSGLFAAAAAGFLAAALLFRPWERTKEVVLLPADPVPGTAAPNPPEPQIYLSLASKPIQMRTSEEAPWQTLAQGNVLPIGACVRTGPDVRCELRTPDGSEVRLNTDTELTLLTTRRFQCGHGQILARVESAASPFEVTAAGTVITALGTEFDVQHRPDETVLTVLEGVTSVQGAGAQSFVLSGERARIIGERVVEKEAAGDLVHATLWIHELLKLKKYNDRELLERTNDIIAQIGQTKTEFFTEEAIRSLGYHCALPLTRFVQSDRSKSDTYRRHTAARLLSEVAEPWSIPDLIKLLADRDPVVRADAASALQRLTKQDFGRKPEQWRTRPWEDLADAYQHWRTWWQENKDKYPPPP